MKTKKGMTLVEIVISLGIYALLALLLTEIMAVVNSTMRATNQLNDRLSYQSKFADNMITSGASENRTETGGALGLSMSYGHVVDADGTLDESGGTISMDSVGNALEYHEWVIGAPVDADGNPREVAGINYAEDINYKFVTYQYPGEHRAELDHQGFRVRLVLMPYIDDGTLTNEEKRAAIESAKRFIKNVDKITIEGSILDPEADNEEVAHPLEGTLHDYWGFSGDMTDEQKYAFASFGDSPSMYSLTQSIDFMIRNEASEIPEGADTVMNSGTITVHFYNAGGQQVLAFSLPELYMYVKNGSTESFYNQTMIALDLNMAQSTDPSVYRRALRTGKSKTNGEGYLPEEFLPRDDDEPTPEVPGGETPEEPGEETPEG